MAGNQERQFRFGAIVHQDYQELAMLLPELEDRLNQNIDLKDYTDRVERIYFSPIMMPEGENGHEEETRFDEEKKQVFLTLEMKLDYISHMSENSFIEVMSRIFSDNLSMLNFFPIKLSAKVKSTLEGKT